jgi:hypothetical protein
MKHYFRGSSMEKRLGNTALFYAYKVQVYQLLQPTDNDIHGEFATEELGRLTVAARDLFKSISQIPRQGPWKFWPLSTYIVLHLSWWTITSHNTAHAYNKGYAIKIARNRFSVLAGLTRLTWTLRSCRIDNVDCGILGCDAVWSCWGLPTFWRNVSHHS